MISSFYSWLLYKLFIFLSKRVDFHTFTRIWQEAYYAHSEQQWKALTTTMGYSVERSPSPVNLPLPKLANSVGNLDLTRNAPQSELTSPRLVSVDGLDGKRQLESKLEEWHRKMERERGW